MTVELSCSDHEMRLKGDYVTDGDRCDYNITAQNKNSEALYTMNKYILLRDENSVFHGDVKKDYEYLLESDVDVGMNAKGIYANISFLVPLREPNADYPLVSLKVEKILNVFQQYFSLLVSWWYLTIDLICIKLPCSYA